MDGTDFLSTTDYPSDKLTPTSIASSFTALARYGNLEPRRTILTIEHQLTYEVMPDGVWSKDAVTWYPFGLPPPDTSGAQPVFQTTDVDVYADLTNFYVVCTNHTASNVNIYYAIESYSKD